ncbi:hypothetical protein CAT7_06743 [Carnobacterium sp. AT7]|uniref:hypothetical protein n=1 Tax=Carnobacterium TaxID=2747 RepID=UPI00015F2BAB|nr:hypothetical protein [Carnobacterium sp. AT7]EDP68918.1 hypothetical protein CAT7_06743 [Carnobacterium sp. AT7]
MSLFKNMIEFKWPILLFEVIFLIGGILLITTGIKIQKQSKTSALISIIVGTLITLISLYILFWTFIVGYNS